MKSFERIARAVADSQTSAPRAEGGCELVALRDFSDCILDAYDAIATHAALQARDTDGHIRRGPCNEDWRRAERDLLRPLDVDLQLTDSCVTALISTADYTAREISLGVEPRWIILLARHAKTETHPDAPGDACGFCSVELPVEVEPAKCCAVLHDGLLGVRILRRRT
ncbi:MAG: hypothetical protein WCA98_16625 [Candidatus Acidiferrales bacterium]